MNRLSVKEEKISAFLRFSGRADASLPFRFFLCLFFSSLVLLVFSVYTTPLNNYYGYDSAFFLLIGKGITQGKIPYIDLYDQKGPMIFYINALGYWLTGSRLGVFLLQIVFMTASMMLVYRIARLWLSPTLSLGMLLAYAFLYAGTVQEGDMTEEWSQIFLLLPLFLSLRFLQSEKPIETHPKWYSFLYGLCLGALFLFRVTNGAAVCGMILAYMILFLREKKALPLLVQALFVLLGCAAVIAPFCLYFLAHDAFDEFIYASLIHNFTYATGGAGARDLMGWLSIIVSILSVCIFCLSSRRLTNSGIVNGRTFALVACSSAVGSFAMFFGYTYRHYFLTLVPSILVILIIGIAWAIREPAKTKKVLRARVAAVLLVCLLPFVPQSVRQGGKVILYTGLHQLDTFVNRGKALSAAITSERDSVWGYDVDANAYLYADLLPCCRYFALQQWMEEADPQVADAIDEMLETDPPAWVFTGENSTEMIEKLLSLGYERVECSSYALFHKTA